MVPSSVSLAVMVEVTLARPCRSPGGRIVHDMTNYASPHQILQLTDPHFFADPDGELKGVHTRKSFKHVLSIALADNPDTDVILMTGDLTQDSSREGYLGLKGVMGSLKLPVYCLPGNHDDPALMAEILGEPPFHYCEPLRIGNWLLPMLDTWDGDRAGGRIGPEGLAALDNQLSASTLPHALVCLHHQPVPMRSRWLDGVGLDDDQQFMDVIAGHQSVKGVVWGHVHQELDVVIDGIRMMSTPSTCCQFLPRQDKFALDELPPGYRRIRLHDDGRIESEVVRVEVPTE